MLFANITCSKMMFKLILVLVYVSSNSDAKIISINGQITSKYYVYSEDEIVNVKCEFNATEKNLSLAFLSDDVVVIDANAVEENAIDIMKIRLKMDRKHTVECKSNAGTSKIKFIRNELDSNADSRGRLGWKINDMYFDLNIEDELVVYEYNYFLGEDLNMKFTSSSKKVVISTNCSCIIYSKVGGSPAIIELNPIYSLKVNKVNVTQFSNFKLYCVTLMDTYQYFETEIQFILSDFSSPSHIFNTRDIHAVSKNSANVSGCISVYDVITYIEEGKTCSNLTCFLFEDSNEPVIWDHDDKETGELFGYNMKGVIMKPLIVVDSGLVAVPRNGLKYKGCYIKDDIRNNHWCNGVRPNIHSQVFGTGAKDIQINFKTSSAALPSVIVSTLYNVPMNKMEGLQLSASLYDTDPHFIGLDDKRVKLILSPSSNLNIIWYDNQQDSVAQYSKLNLSCFSHVCGKKGILDFEGRSNLSITDATTLKPDSITCMVTCKRKTKVTVLMLLARDTDESTEGIGQMLIAVICGVIILVMIIIILIIVIACRKKSSKDGASVNQNENSVETSVNQKEISEENSNQYAPEVNYKSEVVNVTYANSMVAAYDPPPRPPKKSTTEKGEYDSVYSWRHHRQQVPQRPPRLVYPDQGPPRARSIRTVDHLISFLQSR